MNSEKVYKEEIYEYEKLRAFVKEMNIPLEEKSYLFSDIDRAENKRIDKLTDKLRSSLIDQIKGQL